MSLSITPRHVSAALMFVAGSALLAWALLAGPTSPGSQAHGQEGGFRIYAPEPPGNPTFTRHEGKHTRSTSHHASPDDPEDCSGCHPSKHPTPELPDADFRQLLAAYQQAPANETGEALDALLFYWPQTRMKFGVFGHEPLDSEHIAFLRREMSRPGIMMELRVIDSHGVQRITMPPTFWPFDNKQHYFPTDDELVDIAVPDINGTAKRVGLYHIWVRC